MGDTTVSSTTVLKAQNRSLVFPRGNLVRRTLCIDRADVRRYKEQKAACE